MAPLGCDFSYNVHVLLETTVYVIVTPAATAKSSRSHPGLPVMPTYI